MLPWASQLEVVVKVLAMPNVALMEMSQTMTSDYD
jgi:hypothetical protein